MDAYFGYNQINMNSLDVPKTESMSNICNYYYNVMPLRFKNIDTTYRMLMNVVLSNQIGCTLEVYIDDMVVKTHEEENQCGDLEDILKSVKRYNMRLNPTKCSFGVHAGKFLGFMLTRIGIKVNPDKYQTIKDMRSPTTIKEVKKVTRRLTVLSKFLSCA